MNPSLKQNCINALNSANESMNLGIAVSNYLDTLSFEHLVEIVVDAVIESNCTPLSEKQIRVISTAQPTDELRKVAHEDVFNFYKEEKGSDVYNDFMDRYSKLHLKRAA